MSFPDFFPALLAALLGIAVFLLPGYAIGSFADALMFRSRVLTTRIVLAVLLSISVLPIIAFLAARLGGPWVMWILIGALSLSGLFFCIRDIAKLPTRARTFPNSLLIFVAVWVILSSIALADIQSGDRLFQSVATHDFVKHTAVTNAITRTGVPPINPSFYPQHPFRLVYYYFWFLLASLVEQLGGSLVTARAAVLGSIWWTGFGVACLVFLYLRLRRSRLNFGVLLAFGFALLFANGLDILPVGPSVLGNFLHHQAPKYPTVEWWNEQVTGWFASMIWVPHHIAGFLASFTALGLIHFGKTANDTKRRWWAIVLAGFGFASTVGLSIWLALTTAVVGAAWFLVLAYRRSYRELPNLAIAGVLSAVLSLPFLHDISSANQLHKSPVRVSVRMFYPAMDYMTGHGLDSRLERAVVMAAALPLNYALELGFYALAGIAYLFWRRKQRNGWNTSEWFEITILAASMFVATFLRSAVRNNDLGWRAFLPAQFILLLWAARYLTANPGWWRRRWLGGLLALTLALGFATTALDVVLARVSLAEAEASNSAYYWLGRYVPSARQAFYTKEAYLALKKILPPNAIVQHNPVVGIDFFEGTYGDRQVVAADDMYSTLYGTTPEMYQPYRAALEKIFVTDPGADPATVNAICEQDYISALLVKSTDEAWKQPKGWVAKLPVLYQNPLVKVVACGHPSASAP